MRACGMGPPPTSTWARLAVEVFSSKIRLQLEGRPTEVGDLVGEDLLSQCLLSIGNDDRPAPHKGL